MTPTRPAVLLRGVSARVGVTTILRNIDLEVGLGESPGMFGSNGAGKTTLLRVLATAAPAELPESRGRR